MAWTRLEVHDMLIEILGNRNVYYQPPESFKLTYPCIIYSLADIDPLRADDLAYVKRHRYLVTHIGHNPDDPVIEDLADTTGFSYDRHFVSDGLHHNVFTFVTT
jgi:hypothetical protein